MKEQIREDLFSQTLYELKIGGDEFGKLKDSYDVGRILLDGESAVAFSGLNEPNEEGVLNLVRLNVDELVNTNNAEVDLESVIKRSRKMGLKFCRPEVVFYVAVKMLEEEGDASLVNIPTEIDGLLRVFFVEVSNGGDVEIGLYDKDRVTGESLFGGEEKFLFDK